MKFQRLISRLAILSSLWVIYFIPVSGYAQEHSPTEAVRSPANLKHLLSLVDSVKVEDQQLTYIRIYANYPDYLPTAAPDEGVACVDDAGRMLEVLEWEIMHSGRLDLVPLARGVARFLLYMQREDGLWYNFIFSDGTINRTHKNSAAGFSWWAARGLRGLAAAYNIFRQRDPVFSDRLLLRFRLGEPHLNAILTQFPQTVDTPLGLRASWLVNGAPDQSAEFLLALVKMHRVAPVDYSTEIRMLADGLLTYQYKRAGSDIDGMFFCWENVWHNWGNLQALALLDAYAIHQDSTYRIAVEGWADNYLVWTAEQGYYWEIKVAPSGMIATIDFPQIAYGIASSYKGIHRLAGITLLPAHEALAEQLLEWFNGNNRAGRVMYDSTTGRCLDGIDSPTKVNRNSGAESTIEALQTLQFASHPGMIPSK
ncbi:MAG: hypothetical protein JSW54_03840 [Fidelibacterota bacterium]|nr:MAG: hypothetical protein JSW54_03840 [Candidatus Neomarinimicrobiota bacterium]